jgi:copper chaperone NosL
VSGRVAGGVALALLVAGGCRSGPEPIRYGQQECAFCRMRVADPRFGSALVTAHGKTVVFDAVECLIEFAARDGGAAAAGGSFWVSDFSRPGELIDARGAVYLRSEGVRSPMGLNALAFAAPSALAQARAEYPGTVVTWGELQPLAHAVHARRAEQRPVPGATRP